MTEAETPKRPIGIVRKSKARLAAVQGFYNYALSDPKLEAPQLVLDILSHYSGDTAGPDTKFLTKLVQQTYDNRADIDQRIGANLDIGWTVEKLNILLLALLRVAVCELVIMKSTSLKIVINEYLNIAHGFFTEQEVAFVNGILDKIGRDAAA